MKSKLTLMILGFGMAFVLYVAAQSKPPREPFDTQGHRLVGVTLCTGPVMTTDGTAKALYPAPPALGKLRIEMRDGTTREINLESVNSMTVSDR